MVIGVAYHRIEYHLPIEHVQVPLRSRGYMLYYLRQIPVAGIIISIGFQQRLQADQVVAAAAPVNVKTFHQQALS